MMESIVLANQGLKSLEMADSELKSKSKNVVHLDLSNNYLTDFNAKYNFPNLEILILDHNSLTTIKNFPLMKNLDTLSVNDNYFAQSMEFSMYCNEKFPNLKMLNSLRNPMNPGYEAYDEYIKYRMIIKKIKTVENLDGLKIEDFRSLDVYNKSNTIKNNTNKNNLFSIAEDDSNNIEEENDLNNIFKMKKRQSTITYSQRMLKKADNLTKFNRKNHSEGNKHITNNDL